MRKKLVIGGVVAAAVVVGAGTAWGIDRQVEAQTTERGTCGGATWELSVEGEDGGTEVSAEIQSSGPGETWEVALVRGDTSLLEGTRTTDEDGEIDVDAFSSGNPGDATYTATFTPADGEPCTASLGS
ncbi:hypothetical protein J2X46_004487 [Nocardioides sp. BE266]|uniref:hypothetical protein n=1 Tax=Nocardioides sp. BE266 TaxID=2817725 RepID=UPI0028649A77|nr:hypothetical protein [Nocardioides sp. BE266]MDR7255480.1 hypothetical protein [Nocardioides sp. BE266]